MECTCEIWVESVDTVTRTVKSGFKQCPLCAAAPEMLVEVKEFLADTEKVIGWMANWNQDEDSVPRMAERKKRLNALVAKAEGKP